MKVQTALYLIPVEISEQSVENAIPAGNMQIVNE